MYLFRKKNQKLKDLILVSHRYQYWALYNHPYTIYIKQNRSPQQGSNMLLYADDSHKNNFFLE